MGCFQDELAAVINRYSRDTESNTPDWILANYIDGCLKNFAAAIREREQWYGSSGVDSPGSDTNTAKSDA